VVSADDVLPPLQAASTSVKGKHAPQPSIRSRCMKVLPGWCMKVVLARFSVRVRVMACAARRLHRRSMWSR
jgi:hypothetical protein